MNRFVKFILVFFGAVSCMDMGFGKSAANLMFGTLTEQLWDGTLNYTTYYAWVGDIIIGFIAGCTGIVFLVQALKPEFEKLMHT